MSHADQIRPQLLDQKAVVSGACSERLTPPGDAGSVVSSPALAIVGGLISQLLKAIVILYIARAFGPAEFGSFSFAFSINGILLVISQFGLPVFGAREVAQTGRLDKGLLQAITGARFLLGLSTTAVALAILHFASGATRPEIGLVAGFGLGNVAMSGFYDWAFQGMGRMDIWALLNITCQGMWLIFTFGVVFANSSIVLLAVGYAIAGLAASLVGWPWLRALVSKSSSTFPVHIGRMKSVLGAGANLGIATLFTAVLVWSDTIAVRWLKGPQAAGLYSAGNRAALALSMLSAYYVLGAFPGLSHSAIDSPREYERQFQNAFEDLAFLFVPGAIWAFFYTPKIMLVLFNNPEYVEGEGVFRIFLLVLLVNVYSYLYAMGALVAHRRDRVYRWGYAASTATLLGLCPLFILKWGIEGAASAALFSQCLALVIFVVQSRGLVHPKVRKALGIPVLLAVPAVLLGTVLHLGFWTSAAALLVTYAAIIVWRLPALSPMEKKATIS